MSGYTLTVLRVHGSCLELLRRQNRIMERLGSELELVSQYMLRSCQRSRSHRSWSDDSSWSIELGRELIVSQVVVTRYVSPEFGIREEI
jgi:hypothetical protein